MHVTANTLRRCLKEDDNESWVDLWAFFERWVASLLRRTLRLYGFTEVDAEDVTMDIWRRLLEDDRRRLASFRGNTRAELKSWFVRISVNYTRNWVHSRRRALRREKEALACKPVPNCGGPTEKQVVLLLDELEPLADEGDVRRLRILAGLEAKNVSDRALRKWSRNLRRKYFAQLDSDS